MAKILILYGTTEGHTLAIAEHIAGYLGTLGHEGALVFGGDADPDTISLDRFDAVIVGASVHIAHHQRYMRKLVRRVAPRLRTLPGAFFSVSLSAASKNGDEQAAAWSMLDRFCDETGWHPPVRASVAGALRYSEYGPIKRFIMRRIARAESGDTDTSRDYVYTDWSGVERFVDSLIDLIPGLTQAERRGSAA